MGITEKGEFGVSTARKGDGELMNADETRLAEMGTDGK
jgi:hypothetical protein